MYEISMQLPFDGYHVQGKLTLPVKAQNLIIFSHGHGRSILMPHEHRLALAFQQEGFGTLIFDTLDNHEDIPEESIDIAFLSRGLLTSTQWLHNHSDYHSFNLGYFGSGTGAAAALKAASELGDTIKAVVSMSGRLDLVKAELAEVRCPTLLIAGELDFNIVKKNQKALSKLNVKKQLAVVSGASHLFEEPDKLNKAAHIAGLWFKKYLAPEKLKSDTDISKKITGLI